MCDNAPLRWALLTSKSVDVDTKRSPRTRDVTKRLCDTCSSQRSNISPWISAPTGGRARVAEERVRRWEASGGRGEVIIRFDEPRTVAVR